MVANQQSHLTVEIFQVYLQMIGHQRATVILEANYIVKGTCEDLEYILF